MNLLREILIERLGGKCVECGRTETLEFDHIDPSTKSFNIASGYSKPKEVLLAEVAKCQLLCNKCHIEKSKKDLKFRPKNCAGGRPLKYKDLGVGVMIRVPESVTFILPQLLDVMQQLEEKGEDSREVILQVLSDIEERLSNRNSGALKVSL
jgi:hypothetical protein